jgi:hypothetical protein
LAALGTADPDADPLLRGRVRTFIECNGYEGVLRAAQMTGRKARREAIADPWAYTVQVFNATLARLSYLYTLVHLAENALRSQVDLAFTRAHGANWYQFPAYYVPAGRENDFVGDATHQHLRWDTYTHPGLPRQIVALESSAAFLEGISMGWLVRMVLSGYGGPLRGVLLNPDGTVMRLNLAERLLEIARKVRLAVAHNHSITNEEFREAADALVRLLEALRFDVPRALQRIERVRLGLVGTAMRRMGITLAPAGEARA